MYASDLAEEMARAEMQIHHDDIEGSYEVQ